MEHSSPTRCQFFRMPKTCLVQVAFTVGVASLVGCRAAPSPERQAPSPRIAVSAPELSESGSAPPEDHCGLDEFPVSKSTQEILADVPTDVVQRPNQMMIAKVEIDPEGRITHLRVLRLAWPALPNSRQINEDAVDSIKRWHYKPTMIEGKAVTVCSDVSVNVDLR